MLDLISSDAGNILECLNLVLDHFDRHYLDRFVKICHLRASHNIAYAVESFARNSSEKHIQSGAFPLSSMRHVKTCSLPKDRMLRSTGQAIILLTAGAIGA